MTDKEMFWAIRDSLLNVAEQLDHEADAIISDALWYIAVNFGTAFECDECGDQTTEAEEDDPCPCGMGKWTITDEV